MNDDASLAFLKKCAGSRELEPGDVFIAATETFQPLDFRKGIRGQCRILHCNSQLEVKAERRTGEVGLVVGLLLDQITGTLFSTNPQQNSFVCYDRHGNRIPGPEFLPRRRYGNMAMDPQGRILVGVHSLHGGESPADEHGPGKLVRFSYRERQFEFFPVEYDGGRGGKHCVSNLALSPDGSVVYYVSEAGRRVMRYDLDGKRQLPDFLHFEPDDPRGTYGLGVLPDGRVLMALGVGAGLFGPDGEELRFYDAPAAKGWTRARLAADGEHFYLGNFLEGILQRRRISDGRVTVQVDIGHKGSLTSVVEYSPEARASDD